MVYVLRQLNRESWAFANNVTLLAEKFIPVTFSSPDSVMKSTSASNMTSAVLEAETRINSWVVAKHHSGGERRVRHRESDGE